MTQLAIDLQGMLKKFQSGDPGLAQDVLYVLELFEETPIPKADEALLHHLGMLATFMLQVFSSPQFQIPAALAPDFIRKNRVLANMLRLSKFRNADVAIQMLLEQKPDLVNLLTLYSPYCTIRLKLEDLFSSYPYLASLWVAVMLKSWRGTKNGDAFIAELMASQALKKFQLQDAHFPIAEDTAFAYFDATYASGQHDHRLRNTINRQMQKLFRLPFTLPEPDMKRILVISANMETTHSVYRCLSQMLYALKPDYHLTLFHNTPKGAEKLDKELFDDIKTQGAGEQGFTYDMLQSVLEGNYGIALFTDIGLDRPSVILSNLRLAPIQVTTYGHPVSSGKSRIDYYIGGGQVEEQKNPQRHFEEQLVLMPGLGVEPVRLNYQPKFPPKAYDWFEIGLSWGEIKADWPHLLRLKEILDRAKKRIRFHFIGFSATRLTLLAAKADLAELFGAEAVHVTPMMPNAEYLKTLESCDLLLDSYPFGSYNRIVDALTCHKPLVALQGEKSYNRFAPALLRQVSLDELIAETPEAFIATSLRLIDDDAWRKGILAKIRAIDLEKQLFNTGNARYFRQAMDAVVAHHAQKRGQGSPLKAITIQ